MFCNLKALGLTLVAVLAMSVMMAPTASAHAPASFTTTSGSTITATQIGQHQLTVTGQTIACGMATYHGTAPSTSFTSISLQPTFAECKSNLGTSVTYTGFGKPGEAGKCWLAFNAVGSAAFECNGGDVTVDAGPCVVHIPAQEFPAGSVVYSNGFSGIKDIALQLNITEIKATHTDGFLCPFGSAGESSTGALEGESTMISSVGGSSTALSWDNTDASPDFFTTTSGAAITGSQINTHTFKITGLTITCASIGFHGTAPPSKFAELAIQLTYAECKSNLGTTVAVTGFGKPQEAEECWLAFDASGSAALECAGGDVTIDIGSCVAHIPAQPFASGLSYTNGAVGGVGDITLSFNLSSIKATHTDGFLCPWGSSGESTEMVYEGEYTVVAASKGSPVALSRDS